MNHEKIVINPEGDKIKLIVRYYENFQGLPTYSLDVSVCLKGKRLFKRLEFDNWSYRKLSLEDRRIYEHTEYLKYVTEEQMQEAKMELWHKMSPQPKIEK